MEQKPIYFIAGAVVVLSIITAVVLLNSSDYQCVSTGGDLQDYGRCVCQEGDYWSEGCQDIGKLEVMKCDALSGRCDEIDPQDDVAVIFDRYLSCDIVGQNCDCILNDRTVRIPLTRLMDEDCQLQFHDCYPYTTCNK